MTTALCSIFDDVNLGFTPTRDKYKIWSIRTIDIDSSKAWG